MTGRELIVKLEQLSEEEKDLQVKFFNNKYEDYESVREVNFSTYDGKFILLNEA